MSAVLLVTFTIATRAQSWFTSYMAATKTRRETIEDKADRMVAEGRYEALRVGAYGAFWVGDCRGDNGTYQVFAVAQWFMDRHSVEGGRVGCNCRYGRPGRLCSHALGAEQLRKAVEAS